MSNAAGTLTVPGGRSQGNLTRTLAVNQRWNNQEQTCGVGTTGDPVPAGTYQADTQEAADALAAADLVCVPIPGDFTEDLEGPGFENSWSTLLGTFDDEYATSPAPLADSYSLKVDAGSEVGATVGSFASDWHVYCVVQADIAGWLLTLKTAVAAPQRIGACGIASADEDLVATAEGSDGVQEFGIIADPQDSVFHCWIDYTSATGALAMYLSLTTTKPGAPIVSDTIATGAVLGAITVYAVFDVIVDHIIVSASPIGNNP